jgi:hypothetical protein
MAFLEYVCAYIDGLLIITRGLLDYHLPKIETVHTRLLDPGHKVNAAKSSFCNHELKYLCYILTREGIKPQPKKVQAILALNPPNNVKELRRFLGMEFSSSFGESNRPQVIECIPMYVGRLPWSHT